MIEDFCLCQRAVEQTAQTIRESRELLEYLAAAAIVDQLFIKRLRRDLANYEKVLRDVRGIKSPLLGDNRFH